MDNRQILSEILVQVLGFLIVFGILKRFAWSKLLGAIDARRKKIEDEFQAIENQRKSLEDLEKDYRHRLGHIEEEARAKIREAANVGTALAKDITEKILKEKIDAKEHQKLVDQFIKELEKVE